MKKPDREEILDLWLKYHNTNTKEVREKLTKEEQESPEWFKLYPCTKKQEDEWIKETKQLLKKKYKMSNHMIEHGWAWLFLDCAPYVKYEDHE